MNIDESTFIAIPRVVRRPVRIDAVLEKRMKEFLLERRRKLWHEEGR